MRTYSCTTLEALASGDFFKLEDQRFLDLIERGFLRIVETQRGGSPYTVSHRVELTAKGEDVIRRCKAGDSILL
jgi:hypothetical protein